MEKQPDKASRPSFEGTERFLFSVGKFAGLSEGPMCRGSSGLSIDCRPRARRGWVIELIPNGETHRIPNAKMRLLMYDHIFCPQRCQCFFGSGDQRLAAAAEVWFPESRIRSTASSAGPSRIRSTASCPAHYTSWPVPAVQQPQQFAAARPLPQRTSCPGQLQQASRPTSPACPSAPAQAQKGQAGHLQQPSSSRPVHPPKEYRSSQLQQSRSIRTSSKFSCRSPAVQNQQSSKSVTGCLSTSKFHMTIQVHVTFPAPTPCSYSFISSEVQHEETSRNPGRRSVPSSAWEREQIRQGKRRVAEEVQPEGSAVGQTWVPPPSSLYLPQAMRRLQPGEESWMEPATSQPGYSASGN